MLRAVKFVLDTRSKALRFKAKFNQKKDKVWNIYGNCNSDFTGGKESRISFSGFCVFK